MKNCSVFFLLVFFCYFQSGLFGASEKSRIDSLYMAYTKATVDTVKINTLIELAAAYAELSPVKSLGFAREAVEIAERIGYDKGICLGYNQIGDYYYEQVNYGEAVKHYLKAIPPGEKAGLHYALSKSNNSIGIIYSNQGKNDLALKYFMKVAKISEAQKLEKRLAVAYNNIGITYKNLGRLGEAKQYYEKALAEFERRDFKVGIASTTNNLGTIAHKQKDDETALKYYYRSIEVFRELGDSASEAGIYTNIGEVYNDERQYKKALEFYLKGLRFSEKFHSKKFRGDAYEGLSQVYANLGDYEKAYKFQNRHLAWKDSVNDEEGMRQVMELEKRMENEKAEKEIEILKQKQEIQELRVRSQEEKLRQSRIILLSVAGVLLVVLSLSFFLYKAYKQIQRTNVELAEKKKEIQDSINYARNIQQAMLPDVTLLRKHFPEGFGLYLPKDVVSGDFYWFNELNGVIYLAVADCTGHGVPGAFMSMIGIDKLNQSLIDKELGDPAELLSSLNISIKQSLKQKDDQSASRDGMDIALCSYDKDKKVLHYAGANRPLWLIREGVLKEYPATKASIAGYTENAQVYHSHRIQLQAGDTLYTFTDGFADQFGGPQQKKFMTKRLRETLLAIHRLPMNQQEAALNKVFDDWKGSIGQVDDVLLLGLRI